MNFAKRARMTSSILQSKLIYLECTGGRWESWMKQHGWIDNERARNLMKGIQMLAEHGIK